MEEPVGEPVVEPVGEPEEEPCRKTRWRIRRKTVGEAVGFSKMRYTKSQKSHLLLISGDLELL